MIKSREEVLRILRAAVALGALIVLLSQENGRGEGGKDEFYIGKDKIQIFCSLPKVLKCTRA